MSQSPFRLLSLVLHLKLPDDDLSDAYTTKAQRTPRGHAPQGGYRVQ